MATEVVLVPESTKKAISNSIMEDARIRISLLMNESWREQMNKSHAFFEGGGTGRTLKDLGLE